MKLFYVRCVIINENLILEMFVLSAQTRALDVHNLLARRDCNKILYIRFLLALCL